MACYFFRLASHSVYAAKFTRKSVCVVADDTDVFILLFHESINCNETCTSVKVLHNQEMAESTIMLLR